MTRVPQTGLLLLSLAAIACSQAPTSVKEPKMTVSSTRVQALFAQTRSACFGRFLVDVPAAATVVYGPAWAPSDIVRYQGEGERLQDHVTAKLAKIAEDRGKWSTRSVSSSPLYGTVKDGVVPEQKIVFGHVQGAFHEITSYVRLGPDLYTQHAEASVKEDALAVEFKFTVAEALSDLNTVARNLRARAESDIPTDPGLCIDGAFIADNPAVTHERVTVGVRLKEFPDVHLSIEVNKNQGKPIQSNELEPRIVRAEKAALADGPFNWRTRIVEFRRGPRQLGAWSGFEYLIRLPADDHQQSKHEFDYMAIGSPSDPYVPMLEVTMKSGIEGNTSGKVKPSVSDEEAVQIWDHIITSIRVRPTGAKAQTSDAAPARLPLGGLSMTGAICPESGWWRSQATALPVQGGRRHFFRAGESMPGIVLIGKSSVWQQLRGTSPTYPASTVWELMDYETPLSAQADKGRVDDGSKHDT